METALIRKYLARRRWHRWFNAIKAMNRMKSFSHHFSSNQITEQSEPEEPEEPKSYPGEVHCLGLQAAIGLPEYKSSPLTGRWV